MAWQVELIQRGIARHGIVTRADVHAVGVTDDQWWRARRAGMWQPIAPGVWHHAAVPRTTELEVYAGSAWLGRRGALSSATALWWLGVDVPEPTQAEFLVDRVDRKLPPGITVHTTTIPFDIDVTMHRGVRTTTAARAVLDWAAQGASARHLEAAIDSAVRLRRTALYRLLDRLGDTGGSGRPGTTMLRELLLDSGGESHLERRFLSLVRVHRLPRPRTQVVLRTDGQGRARVDFLFGDRLVVEVSGRLGHTSDRDRQRDARRRNALQQRGIVVLEFTTADVIDDPPYVLATLRRALATS